MSVTSPPHPPRSDDPVTHDEFEALVEALIEEARQRARRRRRRYGAAALLVAAVAVASFIGYGGRGGGGAGNAALSPEPGVQGPGAKTQSPPLGALPPGAGLVNAFAFDARNPQIVYVIVRGGAEPGGHAVFRTTDGGASWHPTASSGSGWAGANEALAADPRNAGTLYAGTQVAVYKTVNGGGSWEASKRGLPATPGGDRAMGWIIALAVDPTSTNVVYAGSDRVSKSSDGGRSWKTVFVPHPTQPRRSSVSALVVAHTRPETVYAITTDFAEGYTSINESADAGATWHTATVVRGVQGGGDGFVTALAADPVHPTTVYAALGANVLKTTDSGKTWQSIAHGLPIAANLSRKGCQCRGGVTTLAIDPRRPGTLYAALSQGGIFKTVNGGRTWILATSTDLGSYYTVAVDPARPATIYAASGSEMGNGPRILRSTDSGRTWAMGG